MKKLIITILPVLMIQLTAFSADFTSVQDGLWNDPNTWGSSTYPQTNKDNAVVNHNVDFNADILCNSLTVNAGAKVEDLGMNTITMAGTGQGDLIIIGELIFYNFIVDHQMNFIVSEEGSVTVLGYFDASANGAKIDPFEVNGSFDVVGTFDISGHSSTDVTGSGCVYGGSYVLDGNTIFGQTPANGESVCGYGKTWTGNVDTDWYTDGNWNPAGVPTSAESLTIPDVANGNDPIVDPQTPDATAVGNGIEIETGAVLTINPGGRLTCNRIINNTGNDGVVINSDASGTGSLICGADIPGGTLSGSVLRYMSTAGYWHYICTPIIYPSGAVFDDLGMGLVPGSSGDQFYYWDETLDTWIDILNGTEPLWNSLMDELVFNLGQGYAVTYTSTSPTLRFSGNINLSSKTVAVTFTATGGFEGANLVGNPFPAAIAANLDAGTNNFLDENTSNLRENHVAVYLWDEGFTAPWTQTDYDYFTITNISEPTFLEPGQAFMVMVSTNTNIEFNEDIRAHGSASFYKASEETKRFELMVVNPENVRNTTLIGFKEGMTNGVDQAYDGAKLFGNPTLGLYTKLIEDNGVEFAVQALPPTNEETTVKVGLWTEVTGEYTFQPSKIQNFGPEATIILEDKETGAFVDMTDAQASYTFNITSPGTFEERFVLHFKSVVGINDPITTNNDKINTYTNNKTLYVIDEGAGKGVVSIFNMLGQPVMEDSYSSDFNTFELNLAAGNYIVRVISEGTAVSNKIQIQ